MKKEVRGETQEGHIKEMSPLTGMRVEVGIRALSYVNRLVLSLLLLVQTTFIICLRPADFVVRSILFFLLLLMFETKEQAPAPEKS